MAAGRDWLRAVAGRFDGSDELRDLDLTVGLDGRLLGDEVDCRGHSVELVEPLLDPRRARGAVHALEVEANGFRLGGHDVSMIPAGGITDTERRGRCR